MYTEMMNISKQLNEKLMLSAKKVGELNLKTFETLSTKQADNVKSCVEMGSQNVEIAMRAKDFNELAALQHKAMQTCGVKLTSNLRDMTETLSNCSNELAAIWQDAAQHAQTNTEKAFEINTKATVNAVEKVTADVIDFAKEAATKTVEASKKMAEQAKVA